MRDEIRNLWLVRFSRFAGLIAALAGAGGCKRAVPPEDPAARAQAEFERTRAALAARGDPNMMKPMPTIDVSRRQGPLDPKAMAGLIKPLSNDELMVGDVHVNVAKGVVEAPGSVALREGIVEYLAVTPSGKTYESVLALDVVPLHLRLALTLAGLREATPEDRHGGDPLSIQVRWKEPKGGQRSLPATALLVSRSTKRPPASLSWRFTGSDVNAGQITADSTGCLVAVRFDTTALVNTAEDLGNPYRGGEAGLAVNTSLVPPVGTPLTVQFSRIKP
jgi:hypothetical protein